MAASQLPDTTTAQSVLGIWTLPGEHALKRPVCQKIRRLTSSYFFVKWKVRTRAPIEFPVP
jgi:hypothetical protein